MEIIRHGGQDPYKFKVISPFMWNRESTKVGDIVEISDQAEANGMVLRKKVIPVDLPPVGIYIALTRFSLPGRKEKFECERLELIELTGEQALDLMIQRLVIPRSESQWRPWNMHLRQPGR